mmetsp:Transcript_69101/g.122199  ORF Transcript_69101/g.122199 Transcript_69101/m.122199 type:complete len:152 (+) Transcript_69101:203-658(+)
MKMACPEALGSWPAAATYRTTAAFDSGNGLRRTCHALTCGGTDLTAVPDVKREGMMVSAELMPLKGITVSAELIPWITCPAVTLIGSFAAVELGDLGAITISNEAPCLTSLADIERAVHGPRLEETGDAASAVRGSGPGLALLARESSRPG